MVGTEFAFKKGVRFSTTSPEIEQGGITRIASELKQ
jgi:hypothetical protein